MAKSSFKGLVPNLYIHKSLKFLILQAVNPKDGKVILVLSDAQQEKGNKTARARSAGKNFAENLQKIGINEIKFNKQDNIYLGRIQAAIEAIRKQGVKI